MPNFRYRALTQNGEIVNGTISAPTLAEVGRRIEYLRLLPIETIEDKRATRSSGGYGLFGRLHAALLSGESLADAVAAYPTLFPPMYAALVRVGEVSGTLDQVLDMLGAERARSEQMRRKLTDAMQYPAFVLIAAAGVMLFFILF